MSDLSVSGLFIKPCSGRGDCLPQTSWFYIHLYMSHCTLLLFNTFVSRYLIFSPSVKCLSSVAETATSP